MDYAIQVNHISKAYKLYSSNKMRLKEAMSINSKKKYHDDFYALRDVSFNVAKGDIVGIVGTNGSGKSTILKIISGVLQPSSGEVVVNGRISALLELGAGFNMEYSGLENIRLNGMMMGLSSDEIERRIPQIIEFAEIGDFVYQPVKTYSSGMFARLAFAVSINVEPDILIIDEALSVGDMYFQEKCYEQMKCMVKSGKTILFVSHSLPAVRNFCKKAIWLQNGSIRAEGQAEDVCYRYQRYQEDMVSKTVMQIEKSEDKPTSNNKPKNKIMICSVWLDRQCYYTNEDIYIHIALDYRIDNVNFGVGIIIRNQKNEIVTLFNTIRDDIVITEKLSEISICIPNNDFVDGIYSVSANLCDELIMYPYDKKDFVTTFTIMPVNNKNGVPIADGYFRAKHEWILHE